MIKQKLLKFNQDNLDVYNLLMDKSKESGTNASKYVCEAVRYFEKLLHSDMEMSNDAIRNVCIKKELIIIGERIERLENYLLQNSHNGIKKRSFIKEVDEELKNQILMEDD